MSAQKTIVTSLDQAKAVATKMVISAARKLIIRPDAGAPVVSFPAGAIISSYAADNEAPSVVVMNGSEKEPTWQGVSYDTGVVMVNEVPESVALEALRIYELAKKPKTNDALNAALEFLESKGCVDRYTAPLSFVDQFVSPAGRMLDKYTGIVKRDQRDLIPCWKEGGIIHIFTDANRDIQPEILIRTYRNADGSEIDIKDIKCIEEER